VDVTWEQHRVAVEDSTQIGEARRIAALLSQSSGLSAADAGKVALVVNELGTNLLRHATRGELLLAAMPKGVEILALDGGPGMNVDASLVDGNSTTATRGEGLGAVRRAAALFDAWSYPHMGAALLARIGIDGLNSAFQAGCVCIPVSGETECGDGWEVTSTDSGVRAVVADGLGHGPLAAHAAAAAIAAFRSGQHLPGSQALVHAMHEALRDTRGAAVAAIELSATERTARFAGIGNIAATVVAGGATRGLPSHNGIAGHEARRTQEFSVPWPRGSVFVAHSDGVGSHWKLAAYPGLERRHPAIIAAVLYRDFRRDRDDATVIAVKDA
jgi:anti-sigma regulatory factor (Ser/Thr protein kinase)